MPKPKMYGILWFRTHELTSKNDQVLEELPKMGFVVTTVENITDE